MIKIVEYLKYYLKKESQFDTKTIITDDDFISFIDKTGDNVFNNCKIKISDLKKHLGNGGNSGGDSSATISIYIDEETNHWIINGEDTGIEATGPQGPQGPAGKDGKNGVDGYDGQPGANGDVYIKKFTKTSSIDIKPTFVANKVDPGSIWSAWLPEYNTGEAIWEIVARISANNTLVENWSGPILMTGIQGPSGGEAATPNWKLTLYTLSDNIPSAPNNTNPNYYTTSTTWKPYPTSSTGNWWQCICSVDGPTNLITNFSSVVPLNGQKGDQGIQGEQGLPGEDGVNGQTSYFHVKFADDANGTNMNDVGGDYIGTYVDFIPDDSNDPNDYTWVLTKGAQGEKGDQGIPGKDGDGRTSYLHIAYANSADGTVDFSISDSTNKSYIGQYVDFTKEDSTNPSDYKWSKIKGEDGTNGKDGEDGKDGIDGEDGKDGKYTEFRFTSTNSSLTPPQYSASTRNPSVSGVRIWSTVVPEQADGYYIWMIQAIINADETLYQNWSVPVCVTIPGPQGETGPTGPEGPGGINGIDGINGVSMEFRYIIGTADSPRYAWSSSMSYVRQPSNWSLTVPTTTENYPYIWFIQARINDYSSSNIGTLEGSWSTPKRLSGINGIDGKDGSVGRAGQIVYPAGIYSVDTTYTLDDYKAPYVLDPQDGNYYVLNVSSWLGSNQNENNNTPAKNVALGGDEWVKLEAFEAIYAKVGIIANGLIGSAVFNSDYMFSQQGIKYTEDNDGNISSQISSNYEDFIPETITEVLNGEQPLDTFIPNIMFNLKEGNAWFGAGDCTIDSEGNVLVNKLATESVDILLPAKDNATLSDVQAKATLYGYDYNEYNWNTWTKVDNIVTECIKYIHNLNTIIKNYSVDIPIDSYGEDGSKRVVILRIIEPKLIPGKWYEGSITYIPYYKHKDSNDYITIKLDSIFLVEDSLNYSNSHNTFYLGGKYTTLKYKFRWSGENYELGVGSMNHITGAAANPAYALGDLHVINGITKLEDLFDVDTSNEDTSAEDIAALQQSLLELQTNYNTLNSTVSGLNTTVSRHDSSIIQHTTKLNNYGNEISEHTSTITDLEARVTALEQEKLALSSEE